MKNILTIFLITLTVNCFGQVYGSMIQKDPAQHADTANIVVLSPSGSGGLTGRGKVVSYETLAANLREYIAGVDTAYVNTGDSLVIIDSSGDTIFFAGGGGVGVTDGDKGDITVSIGGTVWTIDSGLAATKIANGTVTNAEFQYIGGVTSDVQTQLNNKAASGANTDINSVALDNTGLKIKDGTKTLTITSGSGLSADRTLTLNVNNLDQTIDLEAGIHVVGAGSSAELAAGSYVEGSNTGDQDLSGYATTGALALKVNISDTAAMLSHFIERGDTATMLAHFVERADTSNMLVPYINRGDTSTMLVPYISRGDTLSMLSHYIERGDTATMLSNYPTKGEAVLLTTDQSVNGEKTFNDSLRVDDYALFKGLNGGLPTKIEMLKEGYIQIDHSTDASSRYAYFMKYKPLQQDQGNTDFNFGIGSTPFTGLRNNDVFMMGWNLAPGGSPEVSLKGSLGIAMENHYRPIGGAYFEWHLLVSDTLGNDYRPITLFFDKGDPSLWVGAFQMPTIEFRLPSGGNGYFEVKHQDDADDITTMDLMSPSDGNVGVQFAVDPIGNNLQIANAGMTTPTLYLNTFYWTEVARLKVGADQNTATHLTGRDGSGWVSTLPWATASDSLKANGVLDHDWYETGGTSAPNAITDEMFHSGNIGVGIIDPDVRMHVYGISTDIDNATEENGIMIIEGSATNALHIGLNSSSPYGAYIQSGSGGNPATTYPIYLNPLGGNVGVGNQDPQAVLHLTKTTEQLRVGYNGSNYQSTTIGSTGSATIDLVGTSPETTFSDAVNVPDEVYDATGWNGNTEVATKNAIRDKIETLSSGGITFQQVLAISALRL